MYPRYIIKRIKIKIPSGYHNFFNVRMLSINGTSISFMIKNEDGPDPLLNFSGKVIKIETYYHPTKKDIPFCGKITIKNEEGLFETYENIYNLVEGCGYLSFDIRGSKQLQNHISMRGKLIPIEDYPFFWAKIFKE